MPITTTYAPITYSGNGVTASFTISFPYQFDTDIVAHTQIGSATPILLVMGTDYAVNPISNSPAQIGTLALLGAALPTGTNLIIERDVPVTQDTSWVPNDPNPSTATMNAVDKLTMIVQDSIATPFDLGGTAATFLRGDNVLSNTLIGPLGAFTVPTDTQDLFTVGQAAPAGIRVVAGAAAQASYSFANSGSSNAWDMRLTYDPSITAWGWQIYGGPLLGTFGADGNVFFGGDLDVTGTANATMYTGAADASLLTTGTIALARLGTNAPDATKFLNGANLWAVPTSGGGGVNTTTTGTFTIAAIASTQTVPVTSAAGITVGNYLLISDGTHTIVGQVTVIASLNLTVATISIIAGSAGNIMASGAAVQLSSVPGTNAVQVQDALVPPSSVTDLIFTGEFDASVPSYVDLFITGGDTPGGTATVRGYLPSGISVTEVHSPTTTKDRLVYLPSGFPDSTVLSASSTAGAVLNATGGSSSTFQQTTIGAASITAASLTPALLNCTNALTDTNLFGYDSASGHFKMFAPGGIFTGTAAQFMNGAGTPTNVLAGSAEFILAQTSPLVNGVKGIAFDAPVGTLNSGTIRKVQYNSGTGLWDLSSDQPELTSYCPIWFANATYPVTGIDAVHGASEVVSGMNTRSMGQFRGYRGFWDRIRIVSNPSGTVTIDPGTGPYVRIESINGNFTIALADTTDVPTGTLSSYASEVTIEFDPIGVAYTVTWPSITWVDGGTAPQPSQVSGEVTLIRLVRAQDAGDGHGAKWFGYRLASSAAAAYTDAQARSAVLSSTYLKDSSTIAMNVVAGTSTTPSIIPASVTNAMLAGSIQPSKLQGYPGSSVVFLNGAGNWTTPPGGGGTFSPSGSSYVWNNSAGFQTFNGLNNVWSATLNGGGTGSATVQTLMNGQYTGSSTGPLYQDGNAINVTLNDAYVPSPGSPGMGIAYLNHVVTGRTTGGESIHHTVDVRSTTTSGFNISHTNYTLARRMNGGVVDAVWLTAFSPDSTYAASNNPATGAHDLFNSGIVRIGEFNYGNAWADFGRQDTTGGNNVVSGPWLIPDWPGVATQYHATFALLIGGSQAGAQNWTGICVNTDGIVGKDSTGTHANYGTGGYGLNIHGGSATTKAIASAIRVADICDVGIDLSAATITTEWTSTHTNKAAILLASGQAICFKAPTGANTGVYIWFNGTNLVASKDGGNTTATII